MSCVGEPLVVEAEPCPERCECDYEGPKIVAMGCSGPGVYQTAPPGERCLVDNCAVCDPSSVGYLCDKCEKGFKRKKGGKKCQAKKAKKPRKPRRKVGK